MSYIPAARMPHAVPQAMPTSEPTRVAPPASGDVSRWLAFGAVATAAFAGLVWAVRR